MIHLQHAIRSIQRVTNTAPAPPFRHADAHDLISSPGQPADLLFAVPAQCRKLIDAGAFFSTRNSGGNDSRAMTILVSSVVPHRQIIAIHAPLQRVE